MRGSGWRLHTGQTRALDRIRAWIGLRAGRSTISSEASRSCSKGGAHDDAPAKVSATGRKTTRRFPMPLPILLLSLLLVMLGCPTPTHADVAAGLKAYRAHDVKTALTHWRPAAEQGDPQAQYWLGRLYEEGRGVPQNFVEAHVWYNLAAAQGNADARKARDTLAPKLTREQLASAQERAQNWRPTLAATAAPAPPPLTPQAATTGLLKAVEQGDVAAVKSLLAAGADVKAKDPAGWPPLLRAATTGNLAVAQLLLDAGAEVNAANADGNTPLMGAALAGSRPLAELLLQKGARVDAKNQQGMTARTFAEQKGNRELAASLSTGLVGRRGTDQAEMVLIPAGTFTMGDTHGDGDSNEKPTHPVTVAAFWLDKTDVTNDQFVRFVQASAYAPKGGWRREYTTGREQHPAVNVTWADAVAYCRWAEKRLPTEAEWEYAARGAEGRRYPWGNEWDPSRAHHSGSQGAGFTVPVGAFPTGATPFGLLDMAGNVTQWTSSLYMPYPYSATDGRENLDDSEPRVLRGGSRLNDPALLRSAFRLRNSPTYGFSYVGFRCAQGAQ